MFRLSKPAHSSKAQRVFGVMTSWESCVYSVISQTCLCWLFHFICHADSRGRLRSWRSVHIYGIAINKRHKKKGRAEETVWSRDDVGQQFEDSQKLFLQSVVFICSTEGTIINKTQLMVGMNPRLHQMWQKLSHFPAAAEPAGTATMSGLFCANRPTVEFRKS